MALCAGKEECVPAGGAALSCSIDAMLVVWGMCGGLVPNTALHKLSAPSELEETGRMIRDPSILRETDRHLRYFLGLQHEWPQLMCILDVCGLPRRRGELQQFRMN